MIRQFDKKYINTFRQKNTRDVCKKQFINANSLSAQIKTFWHRSTNAMCVQNHLIMPAICHDLNNYIVALRNSSATFVQNHLRVQAICHHANQNIVH